MSFLAQNGTAVLYILHAVALSLFLLTGCTDKNPDRPASLHDARVADSSRKMINAEAEPESVDASEPLFGGSFALS